MTCYDQCKRILPFGHKEGLKVEINFYESELFYISREKKTQSSIPSHHYHDAYEILYIISGELYYFIGDRTYQVVGGVLLLIDMNEVHRLINSNGAEYERVTLLFKKEALQSLLPEAENLDLFGCFRSDSNAIKLRGHEQNFVEELFDKLIRENTNASNPANSSASAELYVRLRLMELLIFIQRKCVNGQNDYFIESNRTYRQISQIINHIHENYNQRLTLEDISKKFYLSLSHLSRIFKESTGFTFIEYVNNVRMKEACTLLKNSKLTVSEISGLVGFESQTHFGRIFKSIVGIPPLKYRKMNQSKLS
ncbi:AraC family transcriptional regulator [Paenibacillus sp. 79R4]|nr:AraC family transcriptional regulator [Paenibacillus sp. 79R4]NWL86671.1 AraC family transcriptional regulator [Paenibacillus sp. 79R4]